MTKFNNYDLPGQLPVLAWNPIVMRCPGCELSKPDAKGWIPCWHLRMCNRMMHNPTIPELHREIYAGNAPMRMHYQHADAPLHLRKSRVIATQYMGDFGRISGILRAAVWQRMRLSLQHKYLILTKWPENITEDVPDNCWIGTTVTDQATADMRIPRLLKVKARHKWLSVEPICGFVDLCPGDLGSVVLGPGVIEWVASGPLTGSRVLGDASEYWISDLYDQCRGLVAFYDKRDPLFWYDSLNYCRREWPKEWKQGASNA